MMKRDDGKKKMKVKGTSKKQKGGNRGVPCDSQGICSLSLFSTIQKGFLKDIMREKKEEDPKI